MLPLWVTVVVFVAAGAVLVFQGVAIYLARRMPYLGPGEYPVPLRTPRVSAIIAARNEELDLAECLDTLLAQSYPDLEILVVDGGSTDRTREIVRARSPRVRLLEEPPLPEGWVGKNYACQLGASATTGEYLLFTDADVRYHPDAVRATVGWALAEEADLTTLAPRIEMRGFWEKVVLPFYTQLVLTYFRAPRVNRDSSRAAMANGQFMLLQRRAYESVGGHAAIRGYVLEDVELARRLKAHGGRLRIAWAPEFLSTRMYRDRHEMFEGLLKNIHGTDFSVVRQAAFLGALIGFFWLPLAVLPVGVLSGDLVVTGLGAFLYLALFGKHAGFAGGTRGSAAYGLLFPLAVGFYVVVVASSIVRGVAHRPLRWKGREYPIGG